MVVGNIVSFIANGRQPKHVQETYIIKRNLHQIFVTYAPHVVIFNKRNS